MGWLFYKHSLKNNAQNGILRVRPTTMEVDFIEDRVVRISKFGDIVDEFWYFGNRPVYWSNRVYAEKEKITVVSRSVGATFIGSGSVDSTSHVVPHGDGKWTFPDGNILEGVGVAWMGEPRRPLKRICHN